jgi:hypothetical protein
VISTGKCGCNEEGEQGVWAVCYFPEQARQREPALDLSNILLIRRGVDSGRKAATRKEGRAYRQCVTVLSRLGTGEPALDPSNTLLIRRGVDSGRKASTRRQVGV